MSNQRDQIDRLLAFRQRDKFSTEAWNDRCLNPSSDEMCIHLNDMFNFCADKLIALLSENSTTHKLKAILTTSLSSFNKVHYDTEEKEFICDIFDELANIVDVNFKDALNKWMYGSIITHLVKIGRLLKSERNTEILSQPCTKCETALEIKIVKKQNGIPDSGWLIVKCSNCKELNLLSPGPGIKELKCGHFERVETLNKDKFNFEQAQMRLEQIKLFRKT